MGCSDKDFYLPGDSQRNLVETNEPRQGEHLIPVQDQEEIDPLQLKTEIESFAGAPILSMPYPTNEEGAHAILDPLLMASYDRLTTEYGLTHAQIIDIFGTADNPEIALVGLSLFVLEKYPDNGKFGFCNSGAKIVQCVMQALVPCSIFDALRDASMDWGTDAGLRAAWDTLPYSTKKQILRTIGSYAVRKMGGVIGGALVVYSFTDCMLKHKEDYMTDDEDEIRLGGKFSYPMIPGAGTMLFFYGESYARVQNFIYGYEQALYTTELYQNGNNLYSNENHTCILPDGFYFSDSISGAYRVKNGKLSYAYYVFDTLCLSGNCGYPPAVPLPPLQNPFVPCYQ